MRTTLLCIVPLAVAALSAEAVAQPAVATIVLMPEGGATPQVVTSLFELPRAADGSYVPAAEGVDNGARGLAAASDARELGRAFGEAMAAEARDNRESHARGGRPAAPEPPPRQPPGPPAPPIAPEPTTPGAAPARP